MITELLTQKWNRRDVINVGAHTDSETRLPPSDPFGLFRGANSLLFFEIMMSTAVASNFF